MTPMSKRVGARVRIGVMMISLALDVRIRKKERTKKEKVLISFRGGMMIILGF
jgi:hypothetical protein